MKNAILLMAIAFGISATASTSYAWTRNVEWDSTEAKVTVTNDGDEQVVCWGNLIARTERGNSQINTMSAHVAPGSFAWISVATSSSNPFVSATSNIECRRE